MATLALILKGDDGEEVGSMEVEGDLADVGPLFDEAEKILMEATDDPDAPEGDEEEEGDGPDEGEEAGAPSEG